MIVIVINTFRGDFSNIYYTFRGEFRGEDTLFGASLQIMVAKNEITGACCGDFLMVCNDQLTIRPPRSSALPLSPASHGRDRRASLGRDRREQQQ